MKTKEEILDRNGFDFEAFEYENEYSAKNLLMAMDEYATQQLEAERENHVKTNIQILSEATGLSIEELELKNEVQCVRPSEALEAMEAITANHDKEMVEFAEYCAQSHIRLNYVWCHKYGDQTDKRNYIETSDLLTKFRQSKQQ